MKYSIIAVSLIFCSLLSVRGLAQTDSSRHSITVSYEQTHFDQQFAADWRSTSLEYLQKFSKTTLIGKVNVAERFSRRGLQWEAQAYPKFSKKLYAFVTASFSNDQPVFAHYSTGLTVYGGVKGGWEVEGGYRQLQFDKTVWLATAGASKYVSAWLFNVRSFLNLSAPASNQAYFFTAKRFLADTRAFYWLQLGSGVSPDERRSVLLNSTNLVSRRLNAGAKFFVTKKTLLQLSAGYSRDEFEEKTYGNQWTGGAALSVVF